MLVIVPAYTWSADVQGVWAALALYVHEPPMLAFETGDPDVPMPFVSFEYVTVTVIWSMDAVEAEVWKLWMLRRTPKLAAFTCAAVHVVPQRSEELP